MAPEAGTHPAMDARRPAHVRLGNNRHGTRDRGQAKFFCRHFEQRTRALERQRRDRVGLRHRRKEGRIHAEARNPHLPFSLRVVRLELLVGDRPVRHAGAGRDGLVVRQLVELVRQVAPAAAPVGDGPAAHDHPVAVRPGDGLLLLGPAESVPLLGGVGHQAIFGAGVVVQPLILGVILLVAVFSPAALLEDDHREAGHRQLFGHDAPGGSGPDDDEINLGGRRELSHWYAPVSAPIGGVAVLRRSSRTAA